MLVNDPKSRSSHGMRNELVASRQCTTQRLQDPSWSPHLLVGDRVELPLPHRKHNSARDGLEPLPLSVQLVAHRVGSSTLLVKRLLQSYEDPSKNRWES